MKKKKEETKIKIVTSNKLLTRLPILLAQIKAEDNLQKLINKIIPEDVVNKLKQKSIKQNGFLTEHTIENEISQLLLKHKHGNDIHKHGNSKMNKPANLFLTGCRA